MLKKIFLLLLLIAMLVISGCEPPQQKTDQGYLVESKFNKQLYELILKLEENPGNYSELYGSISGSRAYISGALWQEGKGLVRGEVVGLSPSTNFASINDTIVIKTTDYKVMGLRPGDEAYFVCTVDFEPVCAGDRHTTSECYDLWEFDYCRLKKIQPLSID